MMLTSGGPSNLTRSGWGWQAWKVPDEQRLTSRIKRALVALYHVEEQLPPDEPLESKARLGLRTRIDALRAKLSQIAGPESLEEFDAQRPMAHPTPDGA